MYRIIFIYNLDNFFTWDLLFESKTPEFRTELSKCLVTPNQLFHLHTFYLIYFTTPLSTIFAIPAFQSLKNLSFNPNPNAITLTQNINSAIKTDPFNLRTQYPKYLPHPPSLQHYP